MTEQKTLKQEEKIIAALSYLWIASLLILIIKKDSRFVTFHARQGLVLFIVSFLSWVPVIGWLLAIAILVGVVMGFIKAISGEEHKLPLVYNIAEKINI